MLDLHMEKETLVKFRKSMKKFHGGGDHSFSIVEHSKVMFLSFSVILENEQPDAYVFNPTALET